MLFRTRRSFIVLSTLLCFNGLLARADNGAAEAEAEAERLYARANEYVSNITEDGYSYAYIQFYWKRAQSNIDRIVRVYPETQVGRKILAEEIQVGPFPLTYYKERVLPRLEQKRIAAYDAVNCAIFLYNLEPQRWDQRRDEALASIVEVLSRQQRWSEALSFPVLDAQRDLLLTTVFRVAARYKQQRLVEDMIENAKPAVLAQYWPILGEAMVLTGERWDEIQAFAEDHGDPAVRLAILSAIVDRDIALRRAATLRQDVQKGVQKTHYSVLNPDVRYPVEESARILFPQMTAEGTQALQRHRAAFGQKPPAGAAPEVHLAFMEHLAASQAYDELPEYARKASGPARTACEMKAIELLAQENRGADAVRIQSSLRDRELTNEAALAEFRGRMVSDVVPLIVRQPTFVELRIDDPLVLAKAIMEWSLTANRSIRGPSPYDGVVRKFMPGFENLPLPESEEVGEASATSNPF